MVETADIKLDPLKIGNIEVKFPVCLAPMFGYTDFAFRSLCEDHKCGLTFTESVSAELFLQKSARTLFLLESVKSEKPRAVQLLGSNPDYMAQAASGISALGLFDIIDINSGCPSRKIKHKGGGAALMEKPELLKDIVSAVKNAVSTPITVKIRLGLSPGKMNTLELAQVIEEAGASAIIFHARFASNKHSGPADWDALKKIKSEVSIPVIGNGGIRWAEDALRMFRETGVDGVMIGRASIGNPWIFADIHSLLNNKKSLSLSWDDREEIILDHLARLIKNLKKDPRLGNSGNLPEKKASFIFRKHLIGYMAGIKGGELITNNLRKMENPESILRAVSKIMAMNRLETP